MKQHLAIVNVGLVAACPSVFAWGQAPKAEVDDRPNIVVILSDDHTAQSWGIYPNRLDGCIQNDNIRQLAREGCVLDNLFCTNSISVPSRASIITGAYSHTNGVYTLNDGLPPEADNIAKRLHEGGYQTALIGKWHLKREPSGFDYYSVFHDQGEYRNPVFKTADNWVDDDKGMSGVREEGFSTDLVATKSIEWVAGRDKSRPFMLFCHFKATHEPWDFPERLAHMYDGVEFPEPDNLMEFGPEKSGRLFVGQQLENLAQRWEIASADPAKWWCRYPELPFSRTGMDSIAARRATYQKLVRDYLRCGAAIDDNIGRLTQMLDSEGIADNTIVVYLSDQGYFLGEHGFFDKRMMYEESLRMPCVIRFPKEIPAGTRNRDLTLNVDLAALLADYAGVEPPEESQGRSFRSNLRADTPADWRQSIYYRYWTHHPIRPAHLGIRTRRYKLMFLYGDPLTTTGSDPRPTTPEWEFYDLDTDPREDHNAYNDPRYAIIIEDLKRDLVRLRCEVGDTDSTSPRMREIIAKYW